MKRINFYLAVIFIAGSITGVKAQTYGYHYSGYHYGAQHVVPFRVDRVVNSYNGYHWVSTKSIVDGRKHLFIVTMRRNNRILELTMNRHGRVIGRNSYRLGYRPYHLQRRKPIYVYHHNGRLRDRYNDYHDYNYKNKNYQNQKQNDYSDADDRRKDRGRKRGR